MRGPIPPGPPRTRAGLHGLHTLIVSQASLLHEAGLGSDRPRDSGVAAPAESGTVFPSIEGCTSWAAGTTLLMDDHCGQEGRDDSG